MLAGDETGLVGSKAKLLRVPFSKSVKVPDGRFVPGIGWSAIISDSDSSARDLPMKLLQLHWAYYALYMEIDRGLLSVLDHNELSRPRPVLSELEADAEEVFTYYIRVMKARARVDSALASLGGGEQAIWDVIADVQKFDALVGGVDRKVEVLQKIADRRVQEATSASARRSTKILGFLTTLTLVTLAIALLGYLVGGLSDNLDQYRPLRYGFLALGLVAAAVLWWVTFRMRPRPRKRAARDMGDHDHDPTGQSGTGGW